ARPWTVGGRPGRERRTLLAGAAAALLTTAALTAMGTSAGAAPRAPEDDADGTTHRITMYAEDLGDGQVGYGLARGEATIPGPLLEMYEGDTMEITRSEERRVGKEGV